MNEFDELAPLESRAGIDAAAMTDADVDGVEAILGVLAGSCRTPGALHGLPGDVARLSETLSVFSDDDLIRLIGIICIRAEQVDLAVREQVELFAMTDLGMHPHTVEKLNLPTLRGSLAGLLLPAIDEAKSCATCAFRQGTAANQCEATIADASEVLYDSEGRKFFCHEGVADEMASQAVLAVCRGFAQVAKKSL